MGTTGITGAGALQAHAIAPPATGGGVQETEEQRIEALIDSYAEQLGKAIERSAETAQTLTPSLFKKYLRTNLGRFSLNEEDKNWAFLFAAEKIYADSKEKGGPFGSKAQISYLKPRLNLIVQLTGDNKRRLASVLNALVSGLSFDHITERYLSYKASIELHPHTPVAPATERQTTSIAAEVIRALDLPNTVEQQALQILQKH